MHSIIMKKDSFYAGELGIGVNNSLFDVDLADEAKEIINTSLIPTHFVFILLSARF